MRQWLIFLDAVRLRDGEWVAVLSQPFVGYYPGRTPRSAAKRAARDLSRAAGPRSFGSVADAIDAVRGELCDIPHRSDDLPVFVELGRWHLGVYPAEVATVR